MFIAENMEFVEGISLRNVHKMPNQNRKEGVCIIARAKHFYKWNEIRKGALDSVVT